MSGEARTFLSRGQKYHLSFAKLTFGGTGMESLGRAETWEQTVVR